VRREKREGKKNERVEPDKLAAC